MSEQHFNALPAGYQLQEYTLKSVLGHGGFGITYLAADNNLGKDVAIKEYLPTEFAVRRDDSLVQPRSTADNNDYEWGLDRFMKEAQTLGLFRHPNIVPVYRAFKANGTAYMVMEYQQGQSLAELFRKHRSDFTEEDLLGLTLPLLDGLAVVHKAGYLHRDLKPGNIFIREDGSPVLLDFGAARNAVGRKSKNLTSIVTPGYAPLEQYFADGNQGPWTDIYAMASILYQAVAGRIPPEAPARVKRDPITPAAEAGRGRFSDAFLSGIDIGLRVEEEQRPQTVEQWRAMLLGQDVPAAPPPTMGREAAAREKASVRSSATMIAGHVPKASPAGNPTTGGSPSMRFPTVGREDALAHTQRRGMGAGKIAAIVGGVVLLLGAAGAGAFIAMNPDHGLFGTGTATNDKGKTDTTKISAEAEAQRRAQDEARRKAEEEVKKRQQEAEEARRRGDEEARRKAEEERKKAEEEVARRQEEARRRAEEERRRREEEARRSQSEEERRRAEEVRQDQARREEEARRREEEARRRDDEARRRADEERQREQEEARRREQEEASRPKGISCELSVIKGAYASETDCFYVIRLFKLTLETARDGAAASTWSNQRSGATGSIRILATMPGQDGTMCRRFQQTLTVAGRTHSGVGVACFRNNAWQLGT